MRGLNPEALLAWFDENSRQLPWRRSRHPYPVWVSEVMLQQTQVDRVIPFFERFVRRFESVESLAEATVEDVLTAWSGLGYYRRARHLHAAARQIVAQGGFPRDYEGWLNLPGIGPYTAAAITSIAFDVRRPVLDGNVERVLARALAFEGDPKTAAGRRRLSAVAERLLMAERPGDSNQALMEIGATICRPRGPRCGECPLAAECVGLEQGEPERYPLRTRSRQRVVEKRLVAVIERQGRVLLCRRPEQADTLAGLWELPWIPRGKPESAAADFAKRYGGRWRLGRMCGEIRHSITFRDIRLDVWMAGLDSNGRIGEGVDARWQPLERLDQIPTSSLVAKALERAGLATSSASA